MTQTTIPQRIQTLRDEMAQAGLKAVIVPRTDPHLSEYISDHWHTVRFLTGFTGSAGTLVVTEKGAYLWVDSRYFLQGKSQTAGTGIVIMKDGLPETPSINAFLTENLSEGDTVGINGLLMSVNDTAVLRSALAKRGIKLDVNFDPIDRVWADRTALPSDPAFIHDEKYALSLIHI